MHQITKGVWLTDFREASDNLDCLMAGFLRRRLGGIVSLGQDPGVPTWVAWVLAIGAESYPFDGPLRYKTGDGRLCNHSVHTVSLILYSSLVHFVTNR